MSLSNYDRDLNPNFAHISSPQYRVSRSSIVEWTQELTLSFEQLKQNLLEPQIVRMFDPLRDVILKTDGSRITLGAVLNQRFDDTGLDQIVRLFSRSLTG